MEKAVSAAESFTSGRPIAVDFAVIERELAALWKEAGHVAPGETLPPVMHACLLNMMVCCPEPAWAGRVSKTIAEVTRVHPARVLMAIVDPRAAGDSLHASITAHCALAPSAGRGRQVCCEEISILASLAALPRVPGVLLPLLLPDLPVVLWWPDEPHLEWPVARGLTGAADLIVVDSRRFGDPAAQYRRLTALARPIADLSWQRLRGWRELAAGMFDGQAFEEYPARIERVTVESSGGPAPAPGDRTFSAEGMLLGAWAASRLKWHPAPLLSASGTAGGDASATFLLARADGGQAEMILQQVASDDRPGRITALRLEAADASFELRRAWVADCVTASVTMPGTCPVPRTARVVERDEATLICRSLQSVGRDVIYDDALHLAARVLGPEH